MTARPTDSSSRALITGVRGQDGTLLARLLAERGYTVYGIARGTSDPPASDNPPVLAIEADVLDETSLLSALEACRPQEIYNLASPSFVPLSWEQPVLTAEFAAVGVTMMLETIRKCDPAIRFYQASSSEIFGDPAEAPQSESTAISPVTPYGVAKAYGHLITRAYRRRYGLHASSGILYNHESPLRSRAFLPRKVAYGAAAIALGLEEELTLGDLDARRDWGYAGDYVRAMWLMLQQDEPDDYVIATGETHSVRELVEVAFTHVGLDWRDHVRTDASLVRGRAELHNLVGDPSKAQQRLGWKRSRNFKEVVHLLVDADLNRLHEQTRARTLNRHSRS